MIQTASAGRRTTSGEDRTADLTEATADVQPSGYAGSPEPAETVSLLDKDGDPVEHPDYRNLLDADTLRAMYREMVLARRLDLEGTNLQRQGQLCLWAPLRGQEAAQIGAVHAMRDTDFCFPSYRELAIALARGMDPVDIFAMFRGVEHTSWDVQRYRFGLYSIVIGAQTLQAVGYGMAVNLDDSDEVVLCCLGDGSTSEGHVNEAFNYAAVFDAPVVFFIQNNQWAISVPNQRQYRGSLFHRSSGFGFPGVRVDGNDVMAVHAVTSAAVERARRGGGPMLIEAFTYRMGAHTTADDPTRYRERAEEEYWQERDPIARLESYLRRHSDDTPAAFFDDVAAEAAALGTEVRERVLALPEPEITDLYQHVLADLPDGLAQERDIHAEYLASFRTGE